MIVFLIHKYTIIIWVWLIKRQKRWFNSCRFPKRNILTMFNSIRHLILLSSRRRWRFSLSVLYCFNFQTIRWNVGWDGFLFLFTTLDSVTLVLSLDLQFCTLYCDFLYARRFWANFPAPFCLLWYYSCVFKYKV